VPSPGATVGCLKVECESGSCNWAEHLESYYASCPHPMEIEQSSCASMAPPAPPPSVACCKKENSVMRLMAVEPEGLALLLATNASSTSLLAGGRAVACPAGYHDITKNNANWWQCGKSCDPMYLTDGGCNCACQETPCPCS